MKYLLFLLFPIVAFGQRTISFQITFPTAYTERMLQVEVDAGKGMRHVPVELNNGELSFQLLVHASRAHLRISYQVAGAVTPVQHNFLADGLEPFILQFSNAHPPLTSFKLSGGTDLNTAVTAYQAYMKPRERAVADFYQANAEALEQKDPEVQKRFDAKIRALNQSRLDYVQKQPGAYYSFLILKNQLLRTTLTPEAIAAVWTTSFPKTLRNTWEGERVTQYLRAKQLGPGDLAPLFSVKTADGDDLSLSDYRGKQTVLLIFWASWCSFCRAEIPELRSIRAMFPEEQLIMIGISQDVNREDWLKTISEEKLDWRQVLQDEQIAQLYPAVALPTIVLIDQDGVIRLKGEGFREDRMPELRMALAELFNG